MPTRVLIAGDVCPLPAGARSLRSRLALDDAYDLFVWTLDAAIAAGPPRPAQTLIDFDAACLDELKLAETNLVVTASNHITDFGDAGLAAVQQALASRGFNQLGAGANRVEADTNAYLDLPCGRVAVLAFAETEPRVLALAAGERSGGVRHFDETRCLAAIAAAKCEAEWVWVILHWGNEFVRYPDPEQRRVAHALVAAGASLVVASHTHVSLGYERLAGGDVFYGLGNFMFPPYRELNGFRYRWHAMARRGVLLEGRYAEDRWDWQPRTIRQDAAGLPYLAPHGDCVDYGKKLPQSAAEYQLLYPQLCQQERRTHLVQRLCYMTWSERLNRLKRLCGCG